MISHRFRGSKTKLPDFSALLCTDCRLSSRVLLPFEGLLGMTGIKKMFRHFCIPSSYWLFTLTAKLVIYFTVHWRFVTWVREWNELLPVEKHPKFIFFTFNFFCIASFYYVCLFHVKIEIFFTGGDTIFLLRINFRCTRKRLINKLSKRHLRRSATNVQTLQESPGRVTSFIGWQITHDPWTHS